MYRFSSEQILLPSPQFQDMPKVGLFNGGYEVFHDAALDCMSYIQSYGYGLGTSLVVLSFAMRSIFSPFILLSQVTATKNMLLAPEMEVFRGEMMSAYKTGNTAKVNLLNSNMKKIRHQHGIKNIYSIIPLFQLPFVLYFFWTLQEMAYNVDIYPGITTDGFLWFKDLSEPDPYFLLPLILAGSSFMTMHKNPNSSQSVGAASKYFKYLKYMVFLGIPITSTFPAAIVLNWSMMSVFQLGINTFVFTKRGRKIIGIPQYLPGSILEKHHTRVDNVVIKPKVWSHKPNIQKKDS